MRICTLISSYEESSSPYNGIDPYPDPSIWLTGCTWTRRFLTPRNVAAQIETGLAEGVDVFVNLCDGEPGEDLVGIESIECLERLGAAYTGCDSRFYAKPRKALKKEYVDAGVGTPRYRFVSTPQAADAAADALRFPLIVKPAHGYASIGITRDSVVHDRPSLVARSAEAIAQFGEALLEEFIRGREFTVLAAEPSVPGGVPLVYQPLEVCFSADETFKHFELKWRDYRSMALKPVQDAEVAGRLRQLAASAFVAVAASGYVRFDIRMDAQGGLYVLDCNTNPGLFYPPGEFGAADFILAAEPDGHAAFLRHVIECGQRRSRRSESSVPSVPSVPATTSQGVR